jgi:hypothetical protein
MNESLLPQIYTISLKGLSFPQEGSQCLQLGTLPVLAWSVWVPELFQRKQLRGRSGRTIYLAFFTDMPPTLRKIDEMESTSTSTYYIPGFKVFMHNSNAVKVFHQLIQLRSVGIIHR